MPDLSIIAGSIGMSIIFFLLHIAIMRNTGDRGVMRWLLLLFFIIAIIGGIIELVLTSNPITLVSIPLYFLMVFSYVLAIFGITLTSVRIQLLTTIYQAGSLGISYRQMQKKYNRKILLANRLKRLTSSGEVIYEKGVYQLRGRESPFRIHVAIQRVMLDLYK